MPLGTELILLLWVGSVIFVIYVVMTLLRLLERAVRAFETIAGRPDRGKAHLEERAAG